MNPYLSRHRQLETIMVCPINPKGWEFSWRLDTAFGPPNADTRLALNAEYGEDPEKPSTWQCAFTLGSRTRPSLDLFTELCATLRKAQTRAPEGLMDAIVYADETLEAALAYARERS